jgi:hypothetical protein
VGVKTHFSVFQIWTFSCASELLWLDQDVIRSGKFVSLVNSQSQQHPPLPPLKVPVFTSANSGES